MLLTNILSSHLPKASPHFLNEHNFLILLFDFFTLWFWFSFPSSLPSTILLHYYIPQANYPSKKALFYSQHYLSRIITYTKQLFSNQTVDILVSKKRQPSCSDRAYIIDRRKLTISCYYICLKCLTCKIPTIPHMEILLSPSGLFLEPTNWKRYLPPSLPSLRGIYHITPSIIGLYYKFVLLPFKIFNYF